MWRRVLTSSPRSARYSPVFYQCVLISIVADDWESIFGDPTKFGIGVIVAFFCSFIVFQHYVLYRKSWMKTYELPVACSCEPGCCKCNKEESSHSKKSFSKISDTVALPGEKLQLKNMIIFV